MHAHTAQNAGMWHVANYWVQVRVTRWDGLQKIQREMIYRQLLLLQLVRYSFSTHSLLHAIIACVLDSMPKMNFCIDVN